MLRLLIIAGRLPLRDHIIINNDFSTYVIISEMSMSIGNMASLIIFGRQHLYVCVDSWGGFSDDVSNFLPVRAIFAPGRTDVPRFKDAQQLERT